ncbi:MAG: ABC transporter permease [Chloroflexi bacterium]|nr:ABC transporter permease [Chloroflexota bacterium]MCL5076458.1 ABC transporter permease [Chloroflexota bacterium]
MARGGKLALFLGLLLLIWHLMALVVDRPILPGPWTVFAAFVQASLNGLGWHALVSSYRVVVSILLSVITAAPLGLVLGQAKNWDRLVSPFVYLTYPVPKIVLLPIVLLFLGIGDTSKIFLIWLILFYQVLVVVRDASNAVRPELAYSVRSLGARRGQLLRYVYFPACLPAILTALRVSIGTAIAVLFFTESVATSSGLGYYILVEGWGRQAYAEMYAGVLAMGLLGLVIYLLLDVLQRALCGWVDVGR